MNNQIDPETGEVTAQDTSLTIFSPDTFLNISQQPVNEEQAEILLAETDPGDLDILPTGEVYLTQAKYRQRLNKAFKPGGWALRPLSKPYIKDELAMQEWALYANGQFIAYTVGGAEYRESNQRMNWSDVLETVKSNALMRLCKDLGIASECWNKRFTEHFKTEYCIKVWVEGQKRPQWRRLDSEPFYKETNVANDSPNGYPVEQRKAPVTVEQSKAQPVQKPVQPVSGQAKAGRPLTPAQVKEFSTSRDKWLSDKAPGEKQATYAFTSLSKACEGDDDTRHIVVEYLFGIQSMKDLTAGQCSFVIDWCGAKAENEYTVNPDTKAEIRAIVTETVLLIGE